MKVMWPGGTLAGIHLNRPWPRFFQGIWLLYILFLTGLYFIGVPLIYTQRLQVCAGAGCLPWQVTAADAQALTAAGMSLQFYALYTTVISLLVPLAGLLVVTLIVWRRADDRIALLTVLIVGTCAGAASSVMAALAIAYPTLAWLIQVLHFVPLAGLVPLHCLFPDGRFVPRWSRWLVPLSFGISLLLFFPASGLQQAILNVWWLLTISLSLGLLYYRYRWHANPVQQQQLWWVLVGTAIAVTTQVWAFVLGLLFPALNRKGTLTQLGIETIVTATVVLLMFCFGLAVLRYRLFDIAIIINRTLVYGALTAIIAGVYGLVVGLLSALLHAQGSFVVSFIATAVVAVAFGPLRDRLQRSANRLMYGERDEPYRVISRLGQRLEAAFEPADVLPAIVQAVGETLKLPYVAIGLTLDDWRPGTEDPENTRDNRPVEVNGCSPVTDFGSAIAASYGQPLQPQCPFGTMSPISTLPLVYQGETVGQLFITPRPGEASLSAADQRLLADLAQQAGVAVHGVRLMTDLRRLTADLQCSRERLVLAREEERRRLRRDLHDDLAPTLAGLALTASTIGDLIPADPAKALALTTGLNQSIRAAVGDIRRLVYDLRPPTLDELGLVAAIRERAAQYSNHHSAASRLQVMVEADKTLPPLPAAVEVAAYRITQEALMNVVRHAQARTCRIRLTQAKPTTNRRPQSAQPPLGTADRSRWSTVGGQERLTETLQIEVSDDGIGLTEPRSAGVGLRSMKERAAELGGVCTIERGAKGGTRMFVSLPIPREEPNESTSHPYR
jgi:signal transduction histidine kinase